MLRKFIVGLEYNMENKTEKLEVVTREDFFKDFPRYEPITDSDDKEETEQICAYIRKIGTDQYFKEVLRNHSKKKGKKESYERNYYKGNKRKG